MGAPYLNTLIFAYFFSKKDPFKSINLTKKNVIIDGYSFFYFIYYMVKEEDKNKCLTERITTNKFPYDGLSKKIRDFLKRFKDNCKNVCIVFDGSYEQNQYRRPDPQRDSSVRFNRSRGRLPPLMHDQLMSIIHDLKIKVCIAPGEADPMIVQMARDDDAFIIARDTDYFLYGDTNGYVPLDTLEFSTLQGKYYQMQDVFQGMTQEDVALWATTIIYDFVKFDVLQEEFQMKKAHDARQFRRWLKDSESDSEKCQRLTCQYNMLRYIQEVRYTEAFNKIITWVRPEHKESFEQLMKNYINIPLSTGKLTQNGNKLHQYLNDMYISGKLDPDIIDILVRRQILYLWKENSPTHLRLLSPMCYILIKWDHSISNNTNHSAIVTFNGQTHNALQLIESDDLPLPSLDELTNLDLGRKKRLVLGCVDFAHFKEKLDWHGTHRDYKLWCCVLKLWVHTKTEHSKSLEIILRALTISFLKNVLLDIYGETEERSPRSEVLPEKPYRQHSHRKFKSYFSHKQCADLRKNIKEYAEIVLSNQEIEEGLQECQQVYKELSMINQFFGQPFNMPPPAFCFSRLTYPLAVHLSQSTNLRTDIQTLCSESQLLVEFIEELYEFFVARISTV